MQKPLQEAVFKGRFLLDKSWYGNIIWAHEEFWHISMNFNIAMKVGF